MDKRDVIDVLRHVYDLAAKSGAACPVTLSQDEARRILALLECGDEYAIADPDDGVDFVETLSQFPEEWRALKEGKRG